MRVVRPDSVAKTIILVMVLKYGIPVAVQFAPFASPEKIWREIEEIWQREIRAGRVSK